MYDRWLQRDGRGLVGAKEGHSTAKVSRQQEDELIRTENLADSAEFLQTSRIAEALGRRLERDQRYTYIGDILLAVNPPSVDEKLLEGLESSEPRPRSWRRRGGSTRSSMW